MNGSEVWPIVHRDVANEGVGVWGRESTPPPLFFKGGGGEGSFYSFPI